MEKQIQYTFKYIEKCNMCGSLSSSHKVMGKRLNAPQGKNPRKKIGITVTVLKCTNCGLIYSNPLPIPNNINDHYGVEPEKYWAKEYFAIEPGFITSQLNHYKKLSDFISISPNGKALDIGAGIGK